METEELQLTVGDRTLRVLQVAGLDRMARESLKSGPDPYWAYLWPSGHALVQLVSDLGDLSGRRVLDLGCGLGAAGLAAAVCGADVVLADAREEALDMARRNAALNGLDVEVRRLDWNDPPADLGRFDGILAADVFYEDGMLRGVIRFCRRHLTPDGVALITDPQRVMPGGVAGAARLHGLTADAFELTPGRTLTGGITGYALRPRQL